MIVLQRQSLQRQSGMTLLELLVATAILSIISVMAFLSLNSLTTAKAGMEAATLRINENRLALTLFSQDIKMAISSRSRTQGGGGAEFIGEPSLLRLQRFNPAQAVPTRFSRQQNNPDQDIVLEVRWMLRNNNWYRATRSALSNEYAPWQERLMMPLEQMRCQYRNQGGQLLNRWPADDYQAVEIPQAVQCRLWSVEKRQTDLLLTPWQNL